MDESRRELKLHEINISKSIEILPTDPFPDSISLIFSCYVYMVCLRAQKKTRKIEMKNLVTAGLTLKKKKSKTWRRGKIK